MYNVSENFITQSHLPIQSYTISGNISSTPFTDENILKGSFKIIEECAKKDFNIGYAYASELNATFIGLNIPKYQWIGKIISFEIGLLVGNNYEYVPFKSYIITEAKSTQSGVVVKAYDYMSKFDKSFKNTQIDGTVGDILAYVCSECGVQLKALVNPNKNYNVTLSLENDIETYRDMVYWLAQTLGGFATIDRNNKLEIRQYPSSVCDTLTSSERTSCSYGEYVTNYNGVYVTADDKVEYYGSESSGSTLKLGANPFVKYKPTRQAIMGNIVTAIDNIKYVPFKASIPCAFHYDLADLVSLSGGLGDSTKKFCIMSMTISLNGLSVIQGYGDDPTSKIGNKTDKNIQGLLNNIENQKMAFYEYTNASDYEILDTEKKRVARIKLASNNDTRVCIHTEINLSTLDTNSDSVTEVEAEYVVNTEVQTLHPQETYIDGNHIMHLMYVIPITSGFMGYFAVYLSANGGQVNISEGGIKLFASGLGIVGDGVWTGDFDIEDELYDIPLHEEMSFDTDFIDEVTCERQVPIGINPVDEIPRITILEPILKRNIAENVTEVIE